MSKDGWHACSPESPLCAPCFIPMPCCLLSPKLRGCPWLCRLSCAQYCQTAPACPAGQSCRAGSLCRGHQKVARAGTPSTRHAQMGLHSALVTPGWQGAAGGSGGAGDARPGCSVSAGAAARVLPWVLPRFLPSKGAGTSRVSEAVPAHAEPHPVCRAPGALTSHTSTPAVRAGRSLTWDTPVGGGWWIPA